MTFDNSKSIINFRIRLFAATIIFLTYLALAYVAKLIRFPMLGMSDTFWTVLLAALYLLIAFLPNLLNYQFIYFSDENEKIVLRYYTTGFIGGRKNSVEIEKRLFAGYKTESQLLGLVHTIVLFQKSGEGIAKYPVIYISALKKAERAKMIRTLNLYLPKS